MIEKLLRRLLDRSLADSIAGDLAEERARRAQVSAVRATGWYLRTAMALVAYACWGALLANTTALRHSLDWRAFAAEARQAFRTSIRTPTASLVIVSTLALGLGLNAAIFSLVHGVLFAPLPFERAERLMFVQGSRRGEPPSNFGTSYPNYLDLAREQRSFETLATSCYWTFTVTGTDVPLRLVGQRVTGSFFPMLGMRPILGRWIDLDDDREGGREVAVLSHGLWQRVFGGAASVIGQRVLMNGQSAEIIGVMPPTFAFPFDAVELWAPMLSEMRSIPRQSRFFTTIGRLRDDVTPVAAQGEFDRLAEALERAYPDSNRDWRPVLTAAVPALTTTARPRLMLIFGAVLVVLLIGGVNVTALLVSRTAVRQRELAVRMALGAGRWRLARLMAIDTAWLALAGLLLGLVFATPSLAVLTSFAPPDLPRLQNVMLSWTVAGFAAAAMLLFVLVGALAPLLFRRDSGVARVRSATVAGTPRGWGRPALIVLQVAGAFALLAAGGLLVRSFARVLDVNPGFNPDRVLLVRVFLTPPTYRTIEQQIDFVTRALETLRASPGVLAAAAVTQPPFDAEGSGTTLATAVEGRTYVTGTNPIVSYRGVSPGYFDTIQLPILDGRAIAADDHRGGPLVGVINRAMAERLWPRERAIGRRFEFADGRNAGAITVIGVAGDVATDGLETRESPAVYMPYIQRTLPFVRWMTFVIRTAGDPNSAVPSIRERLQAIDPQQPLYAIESMEAAVTKSIAERRFSVVLMSVFAFLSLVLAALGVYGMLAQRVASRSREIGVRLALGAVPRHVFVSTVREGALLVGIGTLVGAALVFVGTPLLEGSLFGVTTSDPLTYAAIVSMLLAAMFLASVVPAMTAARTDPIRTLRRE